jgi:hypothetical protein
MRNQCSKWAYDEIKASGYVGERQALVLSVFSQEPIIPLTASQVKIELGWDGTQSETTRNRITELEMMGFLRKVGLVEDIKTGKTVNTWIYTGRTKPHESRMEFVECKHCNGKGGKVQKVYHPVPAGQAEFFGHDKLDKVMG